MNNKNHIFIDVKSAVSLRPLDNLIDESFNYPVITVCQYHLGFHMPMWRKAEKGDEAIYAIDDIGVAGGEITYLLKKVFRPRWAPDNDEYKNLIHFAHGMNSKQFDQQWVNFMIEQHWEAIDKKRWLFIVLATIAPAYRLEGNKSILIEKAKMMNEADEELEKEAAKWAMGDYCA